MKQTKVKENERQHSEEASMSEKENFRNSLEMSPFGIEILKLNGDLLFVNRKMLEIWGYESLEDLKQIPLSQRFVPESIQIIRDLKKRSQQGQVPEQCGMSIIRKDGQIRDLHAYTGFVVWNGEQCAQVIFEDITERNRAEVRLKEEHNNFVQSIEKSPFGMEIIKFDGELIYLNPAMLAFWGYDNLEQIKAIPWERRFTPETIAMIHEANKKNAKGVIPSLQELTIIRKDGSLRKLLGYDFEILWNGERRVQIVYEDITEKNKTETDLKKEQDNFRRSIENSPLGIQIIDANGNMVYANHALVDIWGYGSYEELVKTPRTRRFTIDSLKKVRFLRRRRLGGKTVPQHEVSIIRRDGSVKILHGYNTEILWNDIRCSEVIYEDVTEKRQIEEQLKQEQQNFRNLIEMSPLGIQVINFNAELLYTNRTMLDLWGYDSFEELKNTPMKVRFSEDSQILIKKLNEMRRQGKTPPEHDLTIISKGGQIKNLRAYNKEILWNGERCALILHKDVTEQNKMEEQLKQEQDNYRNLVEKSPFGIQIVRNGEELIFANRTMLDIWGYDSEEELKKVPVEKRYTKESIVLVQEINKQYQHGGNPTPHDVTIIRKDGQLRNLHGHHTEIIWSGKKCAQTVFEDVTLQKQMEEKLKKEQENFRNSIEMSPMGIQILSDKGLLVWANKTMLEMWGFTDVRELVQTPLEQRYTPESVATIKRRIVENQVGSTETYELTAIRKNGEQRHWLAYPKDIIWDDQPYVQTIYQDVTEREKAEDALRFSNAAFQSIHEAVWATDNNLRVTHWNTISEKIFGICAAEAIGKHISEVVNLVESYPGHNKERLDKLFSTNYVQEEQLYSTQQGKVWLDVHSQIIQSEEKSFGWVSLAEDITERKRVEEALLFKNTLLEAQAENTIEGIRVNDESSRIVFTNKRFREMWHIPENIVAAEDETVATRHLLSMVKDPESAWQRLMEIRSSSTKNSEDILDLIDGRTFERYSAPMIDTKGNYRGRVWYYRDITEPRRMREKLEQAAEEWRSTFDSITDRISIHDKDNRLIRVNKAFAENYGKTPKEILGKTCDQLAHHTNMIPKRCPWRQVMQTGEPYLVEYYLPETNTWIQESASPLFGNNRLLIGTVNIAKDVTQFKQMEQKLIMSDRLASIGELVSGIAHELNNPLTGVIGFAQLLMEKDISNDIKEDLSVIFAESQRAARVVKNLLTFARKHTPVKQPSNVNTIIEDVLKLREYEQEVNNIEVIKHLGENLSSIMADNFQMQQVFLNIIINAEYFMIQAHNRGTINITTEKLDDLIRITISDDGPGIAPENLSRIFDPFYTTKEVGKGTGLGLSICHGIVIEHGGYMYARSEPGNGASFIIEFPLEKV